MWSKSKQVKVMGAVLALLLIVSAALTACGPAGSAGPAGSPGPQGSQGPQGTPGEAVVSPWATIVVTPSVIKPFVYFKKLEVNGSGFIPGESIDIYLPNGVEVVAGGEKVTVFFDVPLTCVVNDQQAFSTTVSFFLLTSLEEGVYTLVALGSEGSLASCPLVVKE